MTGDGRRERLLVERVEPNRRERADAWRPRDVPQQRDLAEPVATVESPAGRHLELTVHDDVTAVARITLLDHRRARRRFDEGSRRDSRFESAFHRSAAENSRCRLLDR